MKKIIVTLATSLSVVFCIALANAQEMNADTPEASNPTSNLTTDTAPDHNITAANGNLCTNSAGIIYRRGQAGYARCQGATTSAVQQPTDPAGDAPDQAGQVGSDDAGMPAAPVTPAMPANPDIVRDSD